MHDLLFLIEQEEQYLEEGYELELDKRTVTGSASVSRLAPRRKDQWLFLQGERLRRAIDRKQWVITGLLQTPMMVRRYGAKAAEEEGQNRPHEAGDQLASGAGDQPVGGAGGQPRGAREHAGRSTPRGYSRNAKTNPAGALVSTQVQKNEPETNLNEPRTNPSPLASAHGKSFGISRRCGRTRRRKAARCPKGNTVNSRGRSAAQPTERKGQAVSATPALRRGAPPQSAAAKRNSSLKNSSSLSFRGAAGDEESRTCFNFRAGFPAALGMTCSGNVFQRTAKVLHFAFLCALASLREAVDSCRYSQRMSFTSRAPGVKNPNRALLETGSSIV
jgi:hypothetical protein